MSVKRRQELIVIIMGLWASGRCTVVCIGSYRKQAHNEARRYSPRVHVKRHVPTTNSVATHYVVGGITLMGHLFLSGMNGS